MNLLEHNGLCASASTLFNALDVWVRLQELQVIFSKSPSESVENVPFVCYVGPGTNRAGNDGNTGGTVNSVSELRPPDWNPASI